LEWLCVSTLLLDATSFVLPISGNILYPRTDTYSHIQSRRIFSQPWSTERLEYKKTFENLPVLQPKSIINMYNLKMLPTFLGALLTMTATANPITTTSNNTLAARDTTFTLHVRNQCRWVKQVALYQITPSFQMVQRSNPTNINPGQKIDIQAPFYDSGMRLSGHAERGTAWQWNAQALFEFGHSSYNGQDGTAYDLSVMQGSDGDIGIGAWPANGACEGKICFPWDCRPDQGWTNPNQVNQGSPADTVCYYGKTDFTVVFCP
jgi:hypothetical protein